MDMVRIGRVVDKGIDVLLVGGCAGCLVLMTTATFVEVFTRYIWGVSTSQVSTWCVFFLMWLSFATMGIAFREKRHIVMGTLGEWLARTGKKRALLCLDLLISLTIIAFGFAFSYMGIVNLLRAKATGYNTAVSYVPYYWVWFLSLPVGTVTLLFYAIRSTVRTIGEIVHLTKPLPRSEGE